MYLISVYFDEKTNKILQGYINSIALKTGNDFMTKNNVPPHMTISSIEARNADVLIPAFDSLRGKFEAGKMHEGKIQAGEIQIVTVGQLLPYVMYAAPVLNEYLLDLTEKVYEVFKDIPETTVSKYYRPLSWMPHITLAKTLDKRQMQQAFEVMQEKFSPITAKVERIGLSRVNPHEDVSVINLI